MRVYTALPAPARRRSGRPLNTSSLGRTSAGVVWSRSRGRRPGMPHVGRSHARAAGVSRPRAALSRCGRRRGSRLSPPLSCGRQLSPTPPACGLTRRCSGPAVCAGLHCSPGSSPSWVWPAAEHFFVRPHQPGGWLFALPLLAGLHLAAGPRRPRRSSRCGWCRGFQLARSRERGSFAHPPRAA